MTPRAIAAAVAVAITLTHATASFAFPLRGLASIDLTDDGDYAVIAGRKDNSVAIVDVSSQPYTFTNLREADGIGERPIKVRCVGSTAIVVNEWDTSLTLVDAPSATVTGQVSVPMYSQDVVWDAARAQYYVSNYSQDVVYVFDSAWSPLPPAGGIAVGRMPSPMTLGPDGRLYVGNRGSWDVSVVDPDVPGEVARVYIGSRPEDLAATATAVLVTNHGGVELPTLNGVPLLTVDQDEIRNVVTTIDVSSLQTSELFEDAGADYAGIDVGAGLIAFAGAAGGTAHVHPIGSEPSVLYTEDLLEDGTLPGGKVSFSGSRIFTNTRDVAVRLPDQIFAINFLRDTMAELWLVGPPLELQVQGELALNEVGFPILAFQGDYPFQFTIEQHGERYFNTLSAWFREQEDYACQVCHPDGHSDFRMIDRFDHPDPHAPGQFQGPERHPTSRFSAITPPFAWEGAASTLFDFNRGALDAHDDPGFVGIQSTHIDVAEPFLSAFEVVLTSGPNPNPPSAAGQSVFEGIGQCADCHPAPIFTDNDFHDVGTGRVINTPTLLGVWDQSHLLHDARAATLEDVLDPAVYGGGGTPHGNLSALTTQQKADLAAYVRGLPTPPEPLCPETALESAKVILKRSSGRVKASGRADMPGLVIDPASHSAAILLDDATFGTWGGSAPASQFEIGGGQSFTFKDKSGSVIGANGIVQFKLSVKSGGGFRFKLKARDANLFALGLTGSITQRVQTGLFCTTATVPCTTSGGGDKIKCKS